MKKLISFLIFGGLLISFNCHNTAFAEDGGHEAIKPVAISGYQTQDGIKNCCDSLIKSSPVIIQQGKLLQLSALLPASFSQKTENPVFSYIAAKSPPVTSLWQGQSTTVKRE